MKNFDLLIFGATGFTGRFVVETLAKIIKKYDLSNIQWAIAARNSQNMKQCLNNASYMTGIDLTNVPTFEANVNDIGSMNKVFKKSTLVLNCIGPYNLLGEPVVQSCLQSNAHYMDLCGEPLFLEKMQLKYHEEARNKNICMVGSCGFDSIPSDIGTSFLKQNFNGKLNQVEHYLRMHSEKQRFNYATWRALVEGYKSRNELIKVRRELFPKFYKTFDWPITLKKQLLSKNNLGYCIPFPGSDRSVVIRSQMERYTRLGELPAQFIAHFCLENLSLLSRLIMLNTNLKLLSRFNWGENILLKHSKLFSLGIFEPNEEPLREDLEKNRFEITLVGKGWPNSVEKLTSNNMAQQSAVVIRGKDAGYLDTSVIFVHFALALIDKLKAKNALYGVHTPASVMEPNELLPQLNKDGILFEFISNYKSI